MIEQPSEILLVEDDPNDLALALHALRRHEMAQRLQVVRDGAEALDFMFGMGAYSQRKVENVPKVVFLDLKLPKVDGLEVLRRLKADPRTRTVPVVVLTSSREDRDVVESYRLGVNSYIVKPVDFDQFTESLRLLGNYWGQLNQPPVPERQ